MTTALPHNLERREGRAQNGAPLIVNVRISPKGSNMRSTTLLLLFGFYGTAVAVPGVPPEFLGDWVPRTATCQSQLRFRVEVKRVVLINNLHSIPFGNLGFCYSCEGGAKYSGKVDWMMPEFGGTTYPPFTAHGARGQE